jgi:hypothetical protein
MPGVRRNYCTDVQILGGIQDDRECFAPRRFALGNAANIRLCKVHWPKATFHGFIARVLLDTSTDVRHEARVGPFIPMSEGKSTLIYSWG